MASCSPPKMAIFNSLLGRRRRRAAAAALGLRRALLQALLVHGEGLVVVAAKLELLRKLARDVRHLLEGYGRVPSDVGVAVSRGGVEMK